MFCLANVEYASSRLVSGYYFIRMMRVFSLCMICMPMFGPLFSQNFIIAKVDGRNGLSNENIEKKYFWLITDNKYLKYSQSVPYSFFYF